MKNKKIRIIILSILIVVALVGIIWGSRWLFYLIDNLKLDIKRLEKFNGQYNSSHMRAYSTYNQHKFALIATLCLYISAIMSTLTCIFALIFTIKPKFKKIKSIAFLISIVLLFTGLCISLGTLNERYRIYAEEKILAHNEEDKEPLKGHARNFFTPFAVLYGCNFIAFIGLSTVYITENKFVKTKQLSD